MRRAWVTVEWVVTGAVAALPLLFEVAFLALKQSPSLLQDV